MTNRPIRVILADDHPVVRRGLAAIVDIEDDIAVVGEVENGQAAVALTLSLRPDVVLMDLQMPVMDGVEATRQIRAGAPDTQIIILTTFADDEYIYDGIAAGARGYLLKDAPPDQLIEAIRAAHRGESLLDPEVAARILDRFTHLMAQTLAPLPPLSVSHALPEPGPDDVKLTLRELEVLRLMGQGARNKQIAQTLVIAERTVKIHVGNILSKLNAGNRTEAVAIAMKMGLLRQNPTTNDD
ncbi:MAG: response regulator transcription factor [Chloroflexota bacterium]